MANININSAIWIVFCLFVATQINVNVNARKQDDELLVDYVCIKNEKLGKIHFFAQDVTGGPNATVYEVARAAVSADELLSFGKIYVIDDVITAAPGGESEKLGKAQGIMTSSDMKTTAMAMNFNVVFTSGEYNGSALTIAGRNQVMDLQRRLAVVGGTGVFRFTRGYAAVSTYSSGVGEDSAVLEYTIYATYCPMI